MPINSKKYLENKNFFLLPLLLFALGIILSHCTAKHQEHTNTPPAESTLAVNTDTINWTEVKPGINGVLLDMRYATPDNFLHQVLYPCDKCYLRPDVAKALQQAAQAAANMNVRLVLFDCYRPHAVQKKMWELVPDTNYVADPNIGSMHNRGLAVDLSLATPDSTLLNMGTPFDFFGPEASIEYAALPDSVRQNRLLLRSIMENAGFSVLPTEWWHYAIFSLDAPIDARVWECL